MTSGGRTLRIYEQAHRVSKEWSDFQMRAAYMVEQMKCDCEKAKLVVESQHMKVTISFLSRSLKVQKFMKTPKRTASLNRHSP